MKEYLVEVNKTCLNWIEADSKEEAKDIACDIEDGDNVYINDVTVLDDRYIEDEDDDYYDE